MSKKIHGLSKRNWKCFFVGFILAWILAGGCCTAFAGVPVKFTVETSRADVQEVQCYHGETLDFDVTFKNYGKDLYFPTNAEAQIFWQTNGMSAFYWQTNNVNIVSNHMVATFTPEMDPGTGMVFGFIGIPGDIYRASFVLRLKQSPGWKVKEMEWPYRELDFSKVEMKNVPFYFKDETFNREEAEELIDEKSEEKAEEKKVEIISNLFPVVRVEMTNKHCIVWATHEGTVGGFKAGDIYLARITNAETWEMEPLTGKELGLAQMRMNEEVEEDNGNLMMPTSNNGLLGGSPNYKPAFTNVTKYGYGQSRSWTWYGNFLIEWNNVNEAPDREALERLIDEMFIRANWQMYDFETGVTLVGNYEVNFVEYHTSSGIQYSARVMKDGVHRGSGEYQYNTTNINEFVWYELGTTTKRIAKRGGLIWQGEKDPTVPEWAKQPEPPEAIPGNGVVLTNGTVKTKDGTAILPGQVGAYSKAETDELIGAAAIEIEDQVSNVVWRLEAEGMRFYFKPVRPVNMED